MCAAVFSCGQRTTFRRRFAALGAVRHLLDDRRMIGAQVAEQIVDADLVEPFEQVIGGRELGNVGVSGRPRVHDRAIAFG
jgi:hypothetical protein